MNARWRTSQSLNKVIWPHKEIMQVTLRASLHGGGGPQVGEVTRIGGVAHLSM